MGIIRSEKRMEEQISFSLKENIKLTPTGAVNIHIPLLVNHVDFFPSSFKLEVNGKVIFIDPLIVDEEKSADFILITHSHQDHFSILDIKKLLKNDTVIICPKKVHKKLSKVLKGYNIKLINPGNILNFGEFSIESIGAYNLKSGVITPHPRTSNDVGYIIIVDSEKIYHVGDSDYTPEMDRLTDLSVILTPIDGGNLTMSTEKASELINNLKPKYAIPMHYNIGTDQLEKFKQMVNAEQTQVIIFQ